MVNGKYVLLDYKFLFEPDASWTSLSAFESDLADFFAAYGLEAEIIKSVDGQMGNRILLIQKMETLPGNIERTDKKPTPKIPVKKDLDRVRKEY